MAERERRKMAFPRYGEYNAAIRYFMEYGMNVTYILQPELTRRTEELGSRYSPDFVCTPFKTALGSMIEALESGANILGMTHGYCKLGYYGELLEQILRDLGYEFEFINLSESDGSKKDMLRMLRKINPKAKMPKIMMAMMDLIKMVEYIDEITAMYFKKCGFETETGSFALEKARFLNSMYTASSRREIDSAYRQARHAMMTLPVNRPAKPVRVGIIGELYTVMDPFSNLELEQKLADMQVEVHRWMNITNRLFRYSGEKNLNVKIRDYCKYEMGPTSTANIWCAKEYAEQGFDGIVHVKSANCTPEIDIMPVLQRISEDYKIPVLYLTYDSQTSDVGLMTRLEAFYDMLQMRKKVR